LSLENVSIQEGCHPDPFPYWCLEFLGFHCGKILGMCIAFPYCAFERVFFTLSVISHTLVNIGMLE
jgi:hypothetical protein